MPEWAQKRPIWLSIRRATAGLSGMLCDRLTAILVALLGLATDGIAQRCSSAEYNFPYHTNEEPLDLSTPSGTVIVRYPVANVQSVSVVSGPAKPTYIAVTVGGGQLTFSTTGNFTAYEEHEVSVQIMVQLSFRCATGTQSGLYAQTLRLANNHVPRFLRDRYEATVPLPLPKRFDLTPFLADGEGIVARDVDLLNNSVRFGVSENAHVEIERRVLAGDGKSFRAVVRLKEQLLRLPEPLEVVLTGEDEGLPPKRSNVTLVIRQDATIVYEDPPAFKKRLINVSYDERLLIELELFPSSENRDVQFALDGMDARYFSLTASEDHSQVSVGWNGLHEVPKSKTFLSTVVVAKRHDIQMSEALVVVNLPVDENRANDGVTIDKVLVVKRLEEESPHDAIFPLSIENCNYVILSQEPGDFFFINTDTNSLSSLAFDREDRELFQTFDVPQFRLTLKLQCPRKTVARAAADGPSTPWDDIDYSTVRTFVHVLVDDINDNRPTFTYPKKAATFAFPSPPLAARFLPEQLLQVQAYDLDFGLNATIRYSMATNDHFRIDPKTGVVYPLKHSMSSADAIHLNIRATDRDGAEDGHTSELPIRVLRASEQHLIWLTMEDRDLDTFDAVLSDIGDRTGLHLLTLRRVYSSGDAAVGRRQSEQNASRVLVQAVVCALQNDELISNAEFTRALKNANLSHPITVTNAADSVPTPLAEEMPSTELEIYVYIVLTALFGTLAITMAGLAAYLWFYGRQIITSAEIASDQVSTHSESYIVQNALASGMSPPNDHLKHNSMRSSELFSYAARPRQKVSVKPLADLLESDEELDGSLTDRTRNIKFNERVERIEVFP